MKIELIVRGICSLRAGVPGLSENITVRSIVGRYLEHARIYYFYNNGDEEFYLSSADWMPRNLERRVEILFPVDSPELKEQVREMLDIHLADTLKAHEMQSDGTYKKVDRRGKVLISAQQYYCEKEFDQKEEEVSSEERRVFIPREKPLPETADNTWD